MELSQLTSQESQSLYEMPSSLGKRKASSSSSKTIVKKGKYGKRSYFYPGRSLAIPPRNSCVIPLTTSLNFGMSADTNIFLSFDTTNIYIDQPSGSSSVGISGASEVIAVFDLIRVHHVEFTVIPAANVLDYNNQTLTTGNTNIPIVYAAFDPVAQSYRSLGSVQQLATCKTGLFDKPFKQTIYPRLEGANGIVDVGTNQKNLFEHGGTSSTQRWRGWQLYLDMKSVVWTYGTSSVIVKVYLECMMSK